MTARPSPRSCSISISISISCILAFGMLVGAASGAAHTITFSDTPSWTVGVGLTYPDLTITVGGALKFVGYSLHDVVLLNVPSSGTPWDQCAMTGIPSDKFTSIWAVSDFGVNSATERHYAPPTCGDFYITCSVAPHCAYGQRIKVIVNNADGSACASPCLGSACVTSDSKVTATSGTVHGVIPAPNSNFWGMGAPYNALTVEVGDTVIFRTGAGFHDVATVPTLVDFNSCEMSRKTVVADWDYSSGMTSATCNASSSCCASSTCGRSGAMIVTYTFTAETAGDTYFVCSIGAGSHCHVGQRFVLTATAPTTTAPPTTAPVSDGGAANRANRHRIFFFWVLLGLVVLI